MRIYLDTCCLNRPLDDQAIPRNRVESEAVLSLLDAVHAGLHELVSSEALRMEIDGDPSTERQEQVRAYLSLSSDFIPVTDTVRDRTTELAAMGLMPLDALHLACAERREAAMCC